MGAQSGMKKSLTAETSLEDFHQFYWYLKDLVEFCRRYGLDASGRKLELVERVERSGVLSTRLLRRHHVHRMEVRFGPRGDASRASDDPAMLWVPRLMRYAGLRTEEAALPRRG